MTKEILSTPSLGITPGWKEGVDKGEKLSTPSLGITGIR
jgi:hypothetical protein